MCACTIRVAKCGVAFQKPHEECAVRVEYRRIKCFTRKPYVLSDLYVCSIAVNDRSMIGYGKGEIIVKELNGATVASVTMLSDL